MVGIVSVKGSTNCSRGLFKRFRHQPDRKQRDCTLEMLIVCPVPTVFLEDLACTRVCVCSRYAILEGIFRRFRVRAWYLDVLERKSRLNRYFKSCCRDSSNILENRV
ncbi:uncharacterized protein LOC143424749 [Xylocopa sonorina]|uniref:uncharacterized protein LOC143424749 n=1 Tax=Xylocopa sonorina TaxID=1818115 RepID=UPI00403ACC71